ncbi:hypothetical protein NQ152_07215 [Microbacterium sp. zg.B48]|uniref:DUF5979 domain-containing protein n=1 Tax=Microbacterium sp. zg.B48 TaxID=2969408 RepID=UPI00214B4E71|nr:DUF5979 domain-containing protein [Microbacterium sp. zg.B48]MCR2763301.1 hypothetical protein [Microbacterium sp. zg.B48]
MRNRTNKTGNRGMWGRAAGIIGASVLAASAIIAVPSMATADVTGDIEPLATSTTTDIVVEARIAFQRAPIADLDNTEYLEGVTFELYSPAGDAPGAATGLTCVVPAGAGSCTITVPETGPGEANEGDRFFVVMTSAGDSANPIDSFMTGTSSEPNQLRHYAGLTPAMTADTTIAFPTQGEGQLLNSGVVAASLVNPTLAPSCTNDGLSLAVQMDISGSVDATQRAAYRNAFNELLAELAGTPVELSLSTFGSSSPVAGRASGPYSLDDPADVAAAVADVAAFTQPVPGPTQQTNWDLALRTIADAPTTYDALLVLTDGAPNYVSNAAGTGGQEVSGSAVTIAALEQAVFSANAVKAEGTRILVMGIGNGTAGEVYRNLAAISGPNAGSDYFQGGWETLTEDLRNAVNPLVCRVAVTLDKLVVDAAGQNPTPADGWSFSADVADVTAGTTTLEGDSPQATGSGQNAPGEANWVVVFDDRTASASLTLTEAPQAGYSLVDATYTVIHADSTTDTGTGTSAALTIPAITPTDRVEVVFTNGPAAAPAAATFQARKVISGTGAALVPADTAFQVAYTVNGTPAAEPLVLLADGTPVSSPALAVGDEITLTELTPPAVAGVTWGAAPVLEPIVLTDASVVLEIANVATAAVTPAPTQPPAPNPAGSLPVTGLDSSLVPLWLGGGALMIALGAMALQAARRRATGTK